MLAMAKEKRWSKKNRVNLTERNTLQKKQAAKLEIGSSSTWNHDQLELELFKVCSKGDVTPKDIIPEKWFNFASLKRYQSGSIPSFVNN